LGDQQADLSLLAQLLMLPSEQYLADQLETFDPQCLRDVRDDALLQLAQEGKSLLLERYRNCFNAGDVYSLNPQAVGRRSLGNFCLSLLQRLETPDVTELSLRQYRTATNMTDRLAAFSVLVDSDAADRSEIIDDFYQQWTSYPLLIDKWFSIRALSHRPETFAEVEALLQHDAFSLSHPNRVRALLGAFYQNLAVFHRPDGAGYKLLADQILLLDARNPQVAARMAAPLIRWKRLEPQRRKLMEQQLRRLQQAELSNDLYEIVDKSLR
jgi:aminopeptidase N